MGQILNNCLSQGKTETFTYNGIFNYLFENIISSIDPKEYMITTAVNPIGEIKETITVNNAKELFVTVI